MPSPEKPFGSHPVFVVVGIVASLLAVFEFLTNFHSIHDVEATLQAGKEPRSAESLQGGLTKRVDAPAGLADHERPPSRTPSKPSLPDVIYAAGSQGQGVYEIGKRGDNALSVAHTTLYNNLLLVWNKSRDELYCLASNGGAISVLKFDPFREVGTFSRDVGWNADSAAIDPTGNRLYATFAQSGGGSTFRRVMVFDTSSRDEVGKMMLDERWGDSYLALSPDGETVYVSWDDKIDAYDPNLQLVKREQFTGWQSGRLTASHDGSAIYICEENALMVVDTASLKALKRIDIPGLDRNSWIQETAGGDVVTTNRRARQLDIVNTNTGTWRAINFTFQPNSFAPSSDGSMMYVTSENGISAVNVSSGEEVRRIGSARNAAGVVALNR